MASSDSPDKLFSRLVQKEYSHLSSLYFNTAYFGPSPASARMALEKALKRELDPSFCLYEEWMGIPDRIREKLANLLGVPADNIFHSTSTSEVINTVVNGYPFSKGDVVCAIDKDYPSNILPWMLGEKYYDFTFKSLELSDVMPSADWLAEKLPKNCRIFNVSHVTFDTGKKVDILSIGKLCKERDILFVVDATQSFGGMPISTEELKYIDVLAVSSYKWMLGPYGHAFAYIADDSLNKIVHKSANWINSPNSKDLGNLLNYTTETNPKARKFDRGQAANLLPNSCLETSIDFLSKLGLENIKNHNDSVRDYFLQNYPQKKYNLITPKDHMGNIICLSGTNDPASFQESLQAKGIDVSVREGNVRISFHLFNSKEQVDKLIEAL